MFTTLNVKVGSKITFKTDDGQEVDAEILEFPKVVRVKTADGTVQDIRADQIVKADTKQGSARFGSRFQPRL